ncbi:hypothetical protein [Brevundimonas sp.]|jgi:hypothetical protein|uniref:hypothetical protein n=1 Tax=Brevundimonas sp. TaxID=1871086 RepID=UPI0028ACA74F|nr:hypothetical protein [Brevundimonas sp.]
MLTIILAAILAIGQDPTPQSPSDRVSKGEVQEPVRLEDIDVVGKSPDRLIRDFANEVAAPNPGRGIARWDNAVCIGAANLQHEAAQYIVDRVSTVAEDLGLSPGLPGCRPNVLIIATNEPSALATELVRTRLRAFRTGGSGMDRGAAALRAFQSSEHPVRWWQQAMPIDSSTGQRAVRIPGECSDDCSDAFDYAPIIPVFAASRLSSQIVDNIFRTVILIDTRQTSGLSAQQLADYIAMITFAQIDPQADASPYASILNLFDTPETTMGLTSWDNAYLKGLYKAQRTRQNTRAGNGEIIASIQRTRQHIRSSTDDEALPQP